MLLVITRDVHRADWLDDLFALRKGTLRRWVGSERMEWVRLYLDSIYKHNIHDQYPRGRLGTQAENELCI